MMRRRLLKGPSDICINTASSILLRTTQYPTGNAIPLTSTLADLARESRNLALLRLLGLLRLVRLSIFLLLIFLLGPHHSLRLFLCFSLDSSLLPSAAGRLLDQAVDRLLPLGFGERRTPVEMIEIVSFNGLNFDLEYIV